MKNRTAPKFLLLALTALAVAGCLRQEVDDKINDRRPEVEAGVERAKSPGAQVNYNPLVVTDKAWAGSRAIRMRRGLPLPAIYDTPTAITLVNGRGMSLQEIATFVNTTTGIPVRLTDGAERLGASAAPAATGAARAPATVSAQPAAEAGDVRPMQVAYQGNLAGFLETVASHFGVSWRYDGGSIIVSRFETRIFAVEAMAGTTNFSDGVKAENTLASAASSGQGGASASTSASSLEQQTELKVTLDYWAELQEAINTVLGGVGSVRTSPASGTVTVITTPEIMQTVANYLEQENERNTRQVAVTVELFTLSLSDSERYGTDLDVIYDQVSTNFPQLRLNTGAAGASSAITGAPGLSASVISGDFTGTRTLVEALSTIGNVSRVARIPLTTLNNRPASRRIGRDTAYLAAVSTTNSSGSDVSSQTLTPGKVQQGFSLQVTPRIIGDGRILVQFSLSVIDLIGDIRAFTSGDNRIELPETSSRIFVQQAMLNNGDTLVLAGFDEDRQSTENRGMGSAYNMLFGGSSTATDTRDILFLTLTPQEVDIPRRQFNSNG